MADFKLGNASGNPWTGVSPNQTASTMAAWEAQFNASVITNIDEADFLSGIYPIFNVMADAYGATGDGATDDTAAIQAAIDACEAVGGGVVVFPVPSSYYKVTATLTATEGVLFTGPGGESGPYEDTNSANGGTGQTPRLLWQGTGWDGATAADVATTTMIWFKSGTASNYIRGGGVTGLLLDGGQSGASVLVRASSGNRQRFVFAGRRAGLAAVMLDSGNGVLSQDNWVNLRYTWGTNTGANEASSHGVYLAGGDYAAGSEDNLSTQNEVWANGLVYDGSLVYLGGTDNNRIYRCHGTTQSGGSGFSLRFANNPTNGARNNCVFYVAGDIKAESTTYANVIHHWISEGATLSTDSGAQLHFTTTDYSHSDTFQTHRYAMTDELDLPAGVFAATNGSPAQTAVASLYSGWALDGAGATEDIGAMVGVPYDWSNGTITAVTIYYNAANADNGNSWHALVRVGTHTAGGSVATPDATDEDDIAISNTSDNEIESATITLATPVAYTRGQMLCVGLRRESGHVNDDATNDVVVTAIKLTYVSDGPDSGAGSFVPTDPYTT